MRAVRPEKIPYMLVQGDEDSEKRQLELPFQLFGWLILTNRLICFKIYTYK